MQRVTKSWRSYTNIRAVAKKKGKDKLCTHRELHEDVLYI